MRISIDSIETKTKSGIGQNGKPYAIHTQLGYLDTGKRYPVECAFRIDEPARAYPVGDYVIDFEKSVYVDKYNRPALSEELALVPFAEPMKPVKSA